VNSLQDLNNYSNTGVPYEDERPQVITVTPDTPVNQTTTLAQGVTTHVARVGANVTYAQSVQNLAYNINVSAIPGATVTWVSPLPSRVVTSVAGNVYTAGNISGVTTWDQVKFPTITIPSSYTNSINYANNWTYTSSIIYDPSVVKSWTTTVSVTPKTMYYTQNTITNLFGGNSNMPVPVLNANTADTATYTVELTIASGANNRGFLGVGNIFSAPAEWNSSTNTYSYSGNVIQCNTRLAELQYYPARDVKDNRTLRYVQKRNGTTQVDNTVNFYGNAATVDLGLGLYSFNDTTGYVRRYPGGSINTGFDVQDTWVDGFGGSFYTQRDVQGTWTQGTKRIDLTFAPASGTSNKFVAGDRIELNGNLYTVANTTAYNSNVVYTTTNITEPSATAANIAWGLNASTTTRFTLTYPQAFYTTLDVLGIGGGGGGGWYNRAAASGGGGGGQVTNFDPLDLNVQKSFWQPNAPIMEFTIGQGGRPGGSSAGTAQSIAGHRGGNTSITFWPTLSQATTFMAYGGGGGAGGDSNTMTSFPGISGGNGGGGSRSPGGAGLYGGYAGGVPGGGGAGGVGSGSAGGVGRYSTITGANVQYAVGGFNANTITTNGSGGRGDSVITTAQGGQPGAVYIRLS